MKFFFSTLAILITLSISAQPLSEFKNLKYRHLGPERGGRCTAVEGVEKHKGTFYAGYTGGGVWKTTDYGQTWKNISDGQIFSPSIGSIDVFQKDPSIIYIGTGSDGLRSNVIPGDGVYKSTDNGKTWKHTGLKNSRHIGAIETHPDNADIAFVAAIGNAFAPNKERGVYRTKNGGKTWEQVLFLSDTTGFADVEFHPTNPDIIYATAWRAERKPWTIISGGAENGIYRSMDGGDNWEKMDSGLPQLKGKIDLAVSKDDPDRLYAIVEAPRKTDGLYRSDDKGQTFRQISDNKGLANRPFYYTNVHADPSNADKVFSLATRGYQSKNGGKDWKSLSARHGDHHDIWIHPEDSLLMIEANDGGANISHNGGKTWSSQFNQPTAEIYQIEVDNQYPYWIYGGQQDNYTTISVPSLPPYGMQAGHTSFITNTGGCETGPAVPHPDNPDIVYSNCKGKFSKYNKVTGQEWHYNVGAYYMYGHDPKELPYRFQRVSPIHISPHDPSVIYHCSQYVHKTTDEGKTWTVISPDLTAFTPETQGFSGSPITRDITGEEFYSTIYAFQESPLEKGVLWSGANDGPIYVSRDAGNNWIDVTPPSIEPGGRVDAIAPSKFTKGKAYASILRYQLGDDKPYIFKTEDYGKTWKSITAGIPSNYPVRVIREDIEREGLLYAGTEYGLYISYDDGASWTTFQNNLPIVPITDIKVHRNDIVMSTMGRGFWTLDDINALRQNDLTANTKLFKPSDTYAYLYRGGVPSDAPYNHTSYPSPRVNIDYYLAEDNNDIYLEIIDENGKAIRKYRSKEAKKDTTVKKENMNLSTSEYKEISSLKTKKGGHRFYWDFRHDDKVLAKPGNYNVRIFNDKMDFSQSFRLLPDPRIDATEMTTAKYAEQESLSHDIARFNKEVKDYVKSLEKEIKELKKSKNENDRLELLEQELSLYKNDADVHYPQQMFLSQINYLFGLNNRTYQPVSQEVKKRFEQIKQQYGKMKKNL